MNYTYKSPQTKQEWQAYFDLRWRILRAPWQQARGSERDDLEASAYHVMAQDAGNNIIGTGRLHRVSERCAQIRYMAVAPDFRGRGIGSGLLAMLEQQAREWLCREIILNARTESLAFYAHHNYSVIGDAPLLFGVIAHKRMRKLLQAK
ncbi:MAG: GNAT family N-acetyltransferase [Gammaproteobacteria bacterium]